MKFLGLDVGSVSVKLVVLDEKNNKLENHYIRHKGHTVKIAYELLAALIKNSNPNEKFSLSVTGSSGKFIASLLGIKPVNEIVAQCCATQKLYPHIRTVIELGGEDSKLIMIGESASSAKGGGNVKEFFMNSVCAAGTGSFLDQQAERLRLTIEDFSELSLKSKNPPKIAGRCSVFAKSDMIHLQQIATPVEDIVAGLCFAVARNFKGSICRGIKIVPPVSFHGGVAANKGMVRAFENIFELNELFVPPDFAFMCALGAVFKDMAENKITLFDIKALEDFLKSDQSFDTGYKDIARKIQNAERHIQNTKYRHRISVKADKSGIRHQKHSLTLTLALILALSAQTSLLLIKKAICFQKDIL
jgi:predicted CoA-substrate-specific enzyme activase